MMTRSESMAKLAKKADKAKRKQDKIIARQQRRAEQRAAKQDTAKDEGKQEK
jgi:hypothetical protein